MKTTTLSTRLQGEFPEPYVIAEIGVNHECDMDTARLLIRQAKEGGCHAAKFQTYKAGTLTAKKSPSYWDTTKEPTRSQYELFLKYDRFGEPEYRALATYCAEVGIDFLSTPFDATSVVFLEPLVPYFKISSSDITNLPFLRRIGATGKTVILSTGASTVAEIDMAVHELETAGCPEVALLHCVLNYPTLNENAHLGMIQGLARVFPRHIIGYSDHTLPDTTMSPLITAYLLGARVIEKHFTHDKTLAGNDHYHAMDKEDARRFFDQLNTIRNLVGDTTTKFPLPSEQLSRENARRSIVTARPIRKGELLNTANLTCKRPAHGISPTQWDEIVGMIAAHDLNDDHLLKWADVQHDSSFQTENQDSASDNR